MENRSIFWWRHFRSGWRHHSPILNGSRDLGLIFRAKKFWVDWTNQLLAEFMTRHPTFQISTSEKTYILRENPPTKPRFPLRWDPFWVVRKNQTSKEFRRHDDSIPYLDNAKLILFWTTQNGSRLSFTKWFEAVGIISRVHNY